MARNKFFLSGTAAPPPLRVTLAAGQPSPHATRQADIAPSALRQAGGQVARFGMPVDPGNLLFLGDMQGRPVIGLPGNPVSSFVTFLLFARPFLFIKGCVRLADLPPMDKVEISFAGRSNVGKSSLLNVLAGREAAIVTEIAGTTRDALRETIQIEGIPLHIIDTAGLRDTFDVVERIGIERTWREIERADVILRLVDATQGEPGDDDIDRRLPPAVARITVINKIDLVGLEAGRSEAAGRVRLQVSARSGEGVELVRQEFYGWVLAHYCVRWLLHQGAARQQIPHARQSFSAHLQLLRQTLPQSGAFPPTAADTAQALV